MSELRLTKYVNDQRRVLDEIQSLQSDLFETKLTLRRVLQQTGKVRIRARVGMGEHVAQRFVDSFPNLEITFNDRLISHKDDV